MSVTEESHYIRKQTNEKSFRNPNLSVNLKIYFKWLFQMDNSKLGYTIIDINANQCTLMA